MLDLNGYLHLKGVIQGEELEAARSAAERYATAPAESLPPPFDRIRRECDERVHKFTPNTASQLGSAFAFDKSLEHIVFNDTIWPIVMELTNGKPKLKHATLLRDDNSGELGYKAGGGGHLHCAKEDWGRESASFETLVGPSGTTLYTSAFLVFVYLDDVLPGDGGLLVLPGATPHPQPPTIHRPPDSFRH